VPNTSYDGTHAATVTLNIASDILPDPVVNYFTASTTAVNSGSTTIFSWGTEHAVKANMKFSCNAAITATSTQNFDQSFSCDTYLFNPALDSIGQTSMAFINTSNNDQAVTMTLVPSKQAGTYDALRGKSFSLVIHPAVIPVFSSSPSPSPSPSVSATPTPSPSPSPSSSPGPKNMFTQVMKRGSRGVQVSMLQEYLKKDTVLYPEGSVTGYFGPATERAVQRFQTKYGLVTSGTPTTTGYGAVGPKTRNKLNALQ